MTELLTFSHDETLLPVAEEELREAWAVIRPKVAAIAKKCGEPWIAEDVFHELLIGNSTLWALPGREGFVVLRKFSTAYSSDLYVWIAFKDREEASSYFLPQLVEIARSNGCKRVTWESPRPWDKILPEAKRAYTFAVEVEGAEP